ncbi:YhcN/YlaJ family sporulation lipoprotein [Cohnella caldifontis]|uniref:YhcN/YlaJ family sporulation lipoprotein n=1 Tax=Cohnella caldifontis TaxID=3027471 RepID=UPI0023EC6439|nr:YhcN/YlaJ family sporulation lipoprotein [Cohnella sp. YIM B05605]
MNAVCKWILLLSVAALGTAGCARNQAAPAPAPPNNVGTQSLGQLAPIGSADPGAVAAHLEQLARGIHGVNGANCVVFGKYAIVGLDVDPKMERSRVGTVKYAVAEAFRKDPYGINALVTADIDLAQRIREIRADTLRGRPAAGFAEELADIVGRLVPQIPRNVIPPASPENTGGPNARVTGR